MEAIELSVYGKDNLGKPMVERKQFYHKAEVDTEIARLEVEVVRLRRAIINSAPHDGGCAAVRGVFKPKLEIGECDCWKSQVLGGGR